MQLPENVEELPQSYVVVTDEEEAERLIESGEIKLDESGRKLRKTRDWFETEKDYLEYLLVMDALDIELIPGDDEAPTNIKF